jgi:hypothetical protein
MPPGMRQDLGKLGLVLCDNLCVLVENDKPGGPGIRFVSVVTHVVPQSTLPTNSPCLSSRLSPHAFPTSSPSGSVGDPARDSRLGVGGPEYSALVIGLGPEASDDLLERIPGPCPDICICANDGLRDDGADGGFDGGPEPPSSRAAVSGAMPPPGFQDILTGLRFSRTRSTCSGWSSCVALRLCFVALFFAFTYGPGHGRFGNGCQRERSRNPAPRAGDVE